MEAAAKPHSGLHVERSAIPKAAALIHAIPLQESPYQKIAGGSSNLINLLGYFRPGGQKDYDQKDCCTRWLF